MSEEEKLPFFLNTRRLQRAEGYFDIGRTQQRLRKLLAERINENSAQNSSATLQEHASVGFYGVKRYITLEPDPEDDAIFSRDFIDADEDAQYENTSAFSLFWMTFKRIALSIGEQFSNHKTTRGAQSDPECNQECGGKAKNGFCNVLVNPSFRDRRIKQSEVVYGDINYLIQKFRMDLNCGSLDIALFSVEFPGSQAKNFDQTDLQAYVISPECGSFVWIENGKASAIFMTKSSPDFFVGVMEWFRKILSDMALADSVMIGHPYYWHATVRRRLSKVMKYLKRLYRNLALKERERHKLSLSVSSVESIRFDQIEVACPTDISKIVINEQPSENLLHTSSTYEKLNTMLDQLVKKWFDYQRNLNLSFGHSLDDITHAWAANNPQSYNRGISDGNFFESVTFLDFHPDKRESNIDDFGVLSSVSDKESRDSNNNNYPIEGIAETSGQRDIPGQNMEGGHCPRRNQGGGMDEELCEVLHCSTRLKDSETSIDIEGPEKHVTTETLPHNEASMK